MNHHGKVPGNPFEDVWPPPEFRATFPVRYYLMDFGCSVHFTPSSRLRDCLVKPFTIGREQCAPEMLRSAKYDPFAADTYVAARVFYGFFAVCLSFFMECSILIDYLLLGYRSCRSWLPGTYARHVIFSPLRSSICYCSTKSAERVTVPDTLPGVVTGQTD